MKKSYLFALILITGLCFVILGAWFSSKKITVAFINDSVLVSIGCSLIAATIYEKLASTSNQNMEAFYNEVHDNFGVQKVFKNRTQPENDIKAIINESKKELCALGHSMNRFLQQNREEIMEAAKRGVQIKLLALSDEKVISNKGLCPDVFSLINQRQSEEVIHGFATGEHQCNNLIEIVKEINKLVYDSKQGTQILLAFYLALPINSSLFNEKEMVAGGFFHHKESGSSFTLKLKKGELFNQYKAHFNSLWKDMRFVKYCTNVNL